MRTKNEKTEVNGVNINVITNDTAPETSTKDSKESKSKNVKKMSPLDILDVVKEETFKTGREQRKGLVKTGNLAQGRLMVSSFNTTIKALRETRRYSAVTE